VVAVHRTDAGVPIYPGDPADLTPPERPQDRGAVRFTIFGEPDLYAEQLRVLPPVSLILHTDGRH
jgi:hypothetical protein